VGEEGVQYLVGKPEEERELGSPRHRWEDNIKANFGQMG
jgi:hypothetical protein